MPSRGRTHARDGRTRTAPDWTGVSPPAFPFFPLVQEEGERQDRSRQKSPSFPLLFSLLSSESHPIHHRDHVGCWLARSPDRGRATPTAAPSPPRPRCWAGSACWLSASAPSSPSLLSDCCSASSTATSSHLGHSSPTVYTGSKGSAPVTKGRGSSTTRVRSTTPAASAPATSAPADAEASSLHMSTSHSYSEV